MAKATIQFYPNEDKQSKRTELIPIYCRIHLHGKKAEKITNQSISKESLVRWNPIQMRLEERAGIVNTNLNKYEDEFNKIIFNSSTNLYSLTAAQLRDKLFGAKNVENNSVLEYCKIFIQARINSDANLASGTKKNYRVAIQHLENYLMKNYSESLEFAQIEEDFGTKFYDYLISEDLSSSDPQKHKRSIKNATISGIIKKIKRIFERAVKKSLIINNPFSGIRLDPSSPPKEKLSASQVHKIVNYNFSKYPSLEVGRDIFMFLMYTGLGYSDAMKLTSKSLIKNEDGEIFYDIFRQKSTYQAKNFLVNQAMCLVEKFDRSQHYNPRGYVLPRLSLGQLNLKLKSIGELVGISFNLISYTARHSYRQFLHEAKIFDSGTAKVMMGHSRKGDIEAVYYNVTEENLLEAKNKFQLYLDSKIFYLDGK